MNNLFYYWGIVFVLNQFLTTVKQDNIEPKVSSILDMIKWKEVFMFALGILDIAWMVAGLYTHEYVYFIILICINIILAGQFLTMMILKAKMESKFVNRLEIINCSTQTLVVIMIFYNHFK